MKHITILTVLAASAVAVPTELHTRDTSQCPYYLPEGSYEFPHLIVPTNQSDVAIGKSYFAEVSPNNCATIFNFDIPPSRANQQCSLYFTFPRHDQLSTSDFKWNGANTGTEGPGSLQILQYQYGTGATTSTSGNNQPPLGPDAPINLNGVMPGTVYKAWSGSCGVGGVMSWRLSSTDSSMMYFQDWNLCAIGLWVVYENVPTVQATIPDCGHCPDKKQFNSHAAWMNAYIDENAEVNIDSTLDAAAF